MSGLYVFSIFDPDMILHVLAYLTCTLHWVSNKQYLLIWVIGRKSVTGDIQRLVSNLKCRL